MILANTHVVARLNHLGDLSQASGHCEAAVLHWGSAQAEELIGENFEEWRQLDLSYRTERCTVSSQSSDIPSSPSFPDFSNQDIPF